MDSQKLRPDHKIILDIVKQNASVLDLGCGDGELLLLLTKHKKIKGYGIDVDEQAIYDCVAKGLNALHGDIESSLQEYKDKSFDYVILSQSLQQIRHFETVFDEALRVGDKVIIGLPNFANYVCRFQLFFFGKSPVTSTLPYLWYDSPNVHFLSIKDFMGFCSDKKVFIEAKIFLNNNSRTFLFPNFFASTGIFLISKH